MADIPVSLTEAELNALVEATYHADVEDIPHKNDRASARGKLEAAYVQADTDEAVAESELEPTAQNHELHAEGITSKGKTS